MALSFEELSPKKKDTDDFCYAAAGYIYMADFTAREMMDYGIEHDDGTFRMDWHSSATMPKEAARIFLCVKDVRAERIDERLWQWIYECVAMDIRMQDYRRRR